MNFTLEQTSATSVETQCLVIGIHDASSLQGTAKLVDQLSGGELLRLIGTGDVDTDWKSTTMLHGLEGVSATRILVMGCGDTDKFDPVRYDRVCTSAGAFLRDNTASNALVCLHELECGMDTEWNLRQAAIALDKANYRYTTTRKPREGGHEPLVSVSFNAAENFAPALLEAEGFAKAFQRSRELGNLPPNICNPAYLAEQAVEIAKSYDNVSADILEKAEMSELGMRALLAVSQGSENEPKLIILKYQGADQDQRPVVLVGKGITFDSGGISLKPGPNMEQMKFDMGGAASVMGAFEACAHLQLPINVICIVAAAENMPDGKAYRPGDVITSMSGKTIEILNTDAEGRLVLCDALTYSRKFNPVAVIDVATLTGACVIALGHHASAVMSKHDDLAEELVEAGTRILDRGWRLPLWDDYMPQLKSEFADMKNVGGMPAGSVTAGCFLSRFTEDMRWAHIDCAGSVWKWGEKGGSTGRPAGLLTQFLIDQK